MRTESGAWAHSYDDEVRVTAAPPQGPYAIYLADRRGRFKFVVFDLDAKAVGAEQVRTDAAFLAEYLDDAGLAYLVAASGSAGGLHLWVPVNDPRAAGAPASLVARIAHAAKHRCSSVDKSPLTNPKMGCVRPPGAPHRSGGYSRLIEPRDPVAAAAYADAAPNTLERLERFAEALGPVPVEEDQETAAGSGGIIDTEAVRLVGRRREMSQVTRELLAQAPEADASAHLARILTGLALSRWSLADVRTAYARRPDAPGWAHVRSQATEFGRRPRTEAAQHAVLDRQWRRQVAYAARLPRREQRTQDTPQVCALVEMVWSIEQVAAATAEFGHWWRSQSGASDRKAVHHVAQLALEALTDTVEVDGRRLADATGMVHSTAARALGRLVMDGRLILIEEGEGRRAHTYRIVPATEWAVQQVREVPSVQGGTQATPAPADCPPDLTREALLTRMRARSDHAAHDVWTAPRPQGTGGLGRHVEATAAAVEETPKNTHPYDVEFLTRRTGYTPDTIARHLRTLASWNLVATNPTTSHLRTLPERYDDVARALDVEGTRARRMAHYEHERRVWAAWVAEVEVLRAPRGSLIQMTGRRRTPYPRTPDGRPDHAAARAQALAAAA
ncbi:hypothetical protein NE857_33915 (plasmid) [Nocardiopsis exhalans]|uniref:DNA ligase D polymerase domain-containing protein n=1 Tax=Nocardiopsis exhalans TaxID=163604 RepID=A0ABY5DJR8_9ACTN|nr:hypothetical protein [Nocardiopsis exhalans]USY23531.1 hypothetical protein NE857_33915 [Nocardiopsis exhalans]